MPRSIDLEEIKGKEFGGVYVISVPHFPKAYIKIGVSEDDIERRLLSYTTTYPKGFHINAILLFPNNWLKFYHSRDSEASLHRIFKKNMVFGYPDQKRSEWFSLSPKEKKRLYEELRTLEQKTNGALTIFEETHTVKFPQGN